MDDSLRFLSTRQVADMLGLHPDVIARLVWRGDLPPPSLFAGRRGQRWRRSVIEDWVARSERIAQVQVQAGRRG